VLFPRVRKAFNRRNLIMVRETLSKFATSVFRSWRATTADGRIDSHPCRS
jgi:hypothetical protein